MTEILELSTEEMWTNARAYAAMLGKVPSSFSSVIRQLAIEDGRKLEQASAALQSNLKRILKGPTPASMFYYACRTFREECFEENPDVKIRDLLKLYRPLDVAGILACMYLYRHAKKLLEGAKDSTLLQKFQIQSELGALVGDAMPSIGLGTGMLLGGTREMALTAIYAHDAKGMEDYEHHLQKSGLEIDLEYELLRWKTTSLMVSTSILQSLGFGREIPEGLVLGLDPSVQVHDMLDDQSYRVKITREWMNSIAKTQDQPTINMRGQYYPMAQDLERLKTLASETLAKGGRYQWLEKAEADLAPELKEKFTGVVVRANEDSSEAAPETEAAGEDVRLEDALDLEATPA